MKYLKYDVIIVELLIEINCIQISKNFDVVKEMKCIYIQKELIQPIPYCKRSLNEMYLFLFISDI